MQNAHTQEYTVYIIIHCKKIFMHLIFVGGVTHENFLTTKISQSTVHVCTCVCKHLLCMAVIDANMYMYMKMYMNSNNYTRNT